MAINDISTVLVCAFRYALGRATYVVHDIAKELHCNWHELRSTDRELIVREILEHKAQFGKIGHEIDEREWMTLVERYNMELGLGSDERKN